MSNTHTTHIIEFRIGRNIGKEPMPGRQWTRFVDEMRAALEGVAAGLQNETVRPLSQWTEVHTSDSGRWQGDPEESAVVTLYTDSDSVDEPLRDLLVEIAAENAAVFGQDAIAVVWRGASTLVPAKVPA